MVSEIMTRDVQSVSPNDSIRRAAQMMGELDVGALPVCDGDRLVGMVTDRDITVRATSIGLMPDDTIVDEVMSTDVRWCFEDQPLDEVIRQMSETQIRRVPVCSHDDAHRLIGIVSLGDIATRFAGEGQKPDIEQVVEKVSFPSEPDRSSSGSLGSPGGMVSHTGTAPGLAGADVLDEGMSPHAETSSNDDPSDVVEVTPNQLVNRNAQGSTSLSPEVASRVMAGLHVNDVVVIHRTGNPDETDTGESGAP